MSKKTNKPNRRGYPMPHEEQYARIMDSLRARPKTINMLMEDTGLSQTSVKYRTDELMEGGVIGFKTEGRNRVFRVILEMEFRRVKLKSEKTTAAPVEPDMSKLFRLLDRVTHAGVTAARGV